MLKVLEGIDSIIIIIIMTIKVVQYRDEAYLQRNEWDCTARNNNTKSY